MSKINHILSQWPQHVLITTKWLEERGVSRQLADSYVKSGWLERVSSGAYKKPHEEIDWTGSLYTLQKICNLNVHAGGLTALEINGFAHYVRKNAQQRIILWKTPESRLPAWFTNREWNADLNIRSGNLFGLHVESLTEKEVDGVPVIVSAAERAILEFLYDIPQYESFDEAGYIMEGMSSLRPSVLQALLESCRSIKVKRLFLYLAELYSHDWFERLEVSKMDLGSGKREIVKGGKLDKKYHIVIPDLNREDR